MDRRNFILKSIAGGVAFTMPISAISALTDNKRKVKFAVCADVHKDIMHDADARLKAFIDSSQKNKVDFIIQLGDFCRPYDYNQSFLDIWNSFPGDAYHVLGNHDMDGGFSRETTLGYWNSAAKYYSYDVEGVHFVVLDGNDVNPSKNKASGYARFIGNKQLNWLKNDLRSTNKPVILFSHQSLENLGGIENASELQKVLEDENHRAGFTKIVACFSGHHHTDYYIQKNDIYYVQINSMSYSWLGYKFKTIRYSQDIDEKFPWIKYTAPYKEPIWAVVEINEKAIKITGKKTKYVGPAPKGLGVPKNVDGPFVSEISNRRLKY